MYLALIHSPFRKPIFTNSKRDDYGGMNFPTDLFDFQLKTTAHITLSLAKKPNERRADLGFIAKCTTLRQKSTLL